MHKATSIVAPLTISQVSRSYGSTRALVDASFVLSPGITVLLGRNGAGKSTLCRVLAGAEKPDSGGLARDGQAIESAAAWRAHRRRCGWLPQAFGAPPGMTVAQFLEYAAWLKEVPRSEVAAGVDQALEAADLVALRDRSLGHLSGGMFRRVGIAQAVVHQPNLLVLDEPTVGLDPEQRAIFHDLVRALGRDRTVLLSTHLLEDVAALAERTVVLDRGAVVFTGSMGELAALGPGDDLGTRLRTGFLAALGERGAV